MASPFKDGILRNKVALITGGGSGIGFEIALQFGKAGAKVAIMGRRVDFLQKAVDQLKQNNIDAIYVQGDVRDPETSQNVVQEVVNKFGRLDFLVNSAAGNFLSTAAALTPKGFRTVMDIDTVGVFTMSKAAFEELKKTKGVIINISATLHYGATWFQIHASAAKAAIDSLTRSFALEWGMYGIRVVGIAPGPIGETAGLTKLAPGVEKETEALIAQTVPIKRVGTKFDIAMMSLYLCTDAAGFITGDTIVVDGGAWMWRDPIIPPDSVSELSRSVEKKSRAVGTGQSKL